MAEKHKKGNDSVLKRERQTIKRKMRNKSLKSHLKTELKKFTSAQEITADALRFVHKVIDKACSKGVISKNTASGKKSMVALLANSRMSQAEVK